MKPRPGQQAPENRAKVLALARWHRHNQRALAAGRRRIVLSLPGAVIDQLDALRGSFTRSDTLLEAAQLLIQRELAPPPPIPQRALPAPPPPRQPVPAALLESKRDRANRFPILIALAVVRGSDLEAVLLNAGLRHRAAGWTGRVRGGTVRRLAELVAAHGGALHVTGDRGAPLFKGNPAELPPPMRTGWIDALRAYAGHFRQPVPTRPIFSPPQRPRPGHLSPPRHEGFNTRRKQRLVPALLAAVQRDQPLTEDEVWQVMTGTP